MPRTRDPDRTIKGLRHRFHLGSENWNELLWQSMDLIKKKKKNNETIRNDELD